MSTAAGAVRRLLLAPSLDEVTFARRGFPAVASETTRRLEQVPQAVVCGFEWGIESRGGPDVERRLDLVAAEHRGFAYEGVTMAYAIRDAVAGGHRTRDLLRGAGRPHIFLAYIGIGFAMARVPRALWRRMLPDLSGTPYHPAMSWLAVDGYGFDLAYFHSRRWVGAQEVPAPYPWQGDARYFPRAVDQGIGRALWFMHGADVRGVHDAVCRFGPARRPDLWSGVGLAATFAGGAAGDDLRVLRDSAGDCAPDLGVGATFAAKARVHAGFVPAHTEAAIQRLTGMRAEAAAALADDVAVDPDTPGDVPPYEMWRDRIRRAVTAGSFPGT